MGYQENTYIIDPEIEDDEQPIVEKEMQQSISIPNNNISREYEIIDDQEQGKSVEDEIHDAAVKEGLVHEEEGYIGGEGAKPDEVIDAFIHQERSKGALKNEEEYIESKVKKSRKVMATRELLSGITKKHITVTVPMVLDVQQKDGSVAPELCDVDFIVKKINRISGKSCFQ